ncbi:MAG: hypothetical protein ACXACP_14550 [Candidatus Hodarchaeales archaeon]|jgi:hypothetical protein
MATKKIRYGLLFISIFLCGTLVMESVMSISGAITDSSGFVAGDCAEVLDLNDGQVATFWECISSYQNVTEFGSGGYVKFANNQTHLLSLVVCAPDSEWVSIEFNADATSCMQNEHDGWAFYIDESAKTVEARDVYFIGTRMPDIDSKNDLYIEALFIGDLVFIEVARPFATENCGPTGCDITYMNASLNNIQFASLDDHYGAHTIYYLLITDQPVEEDPILPPNLPRIINYDEIKFSIFNLTLIGVFGFLAIHLVRRVIISPIKHEHRLITSSMTTEDKWSPPSFKQRWTETFSREKS